MSDGPSNDDACPDNIHKVPSLPYWKDGDKFPCSYAGTLQASATKDHNLFYWLFKAVKTPPAELTNTLVVWINGGPGSSSLGGLFLENGPFKVQRTGAGVDDYVVGLAPDGSWADISDVVFVDQPVGTGFSYGDSYVNRMQEGADDFARFMEALLQMYPQYSKAKGGKIILSGESYAGKYLPIIHKTMHYYDISKGSNLFDIPATLIGNPFVAPLI